jgi:hypothetical protein
MLVFASVANITDSLRLLYNTCETHNDSTTWFVGPGGSSLATLAYL